MSTGNSCPSALIELLNLLQNQSTPGGLAALKRRQTEFENDSARVNEPRLGNRTNRGIVHARFTEPFDPQVTPQRVLHAFSRSGYPLDDLGCSCSDGRVSLIGRVSSYYYLQMALAIARRFSNGCPIELQVQVEDRARAAPVEESAESTPTRKM